MGLLISNGELARRDLVRSGKGLQVLDGWGLGDGDGELDV